MSPGEARRAVDVCAGYLDALLVREAARVTLPPADLARWRREVLDALHVWLVTAGESIH
jgi:hypothetical protein